MRRLSAKNVSWARLDREERVGKPGGRRKSALGPLLEFFKKSTEVGGREGAG